MPSTKLHVILFLAITGILVSVQGAWCDSIKDRMMARLPIINELKASGVIGENNQGFLEYRTNEKPKSDVVNAENQDRSAVYKAIAARQNATPEFVGQTRAAQIAGNEPVGTWIQAGDGSWSKK